MYLNSNRHKKGEKNIGRKGKHDLDLCMDGKKDTCQITLFFMPFSFLTTIKTYSKHITKTKTNCIT